MSKFPAMNKYFGETAATYDATRTPKATTQKDQARVENYLASLPTGSSVIDIPAGTGRFIQFCVNHRLNYTGVDISPDMLKMAEAKIPAGLTPVICRSQTREYCPLRTTLLITPSSSSLSNGCRAWRTSSRYLKRSGALHEGRFSSRLGRYRQFASRIGS